MCSFHPSEHCDQACQLDRRAVIQANIFMADDEPALLNAIAKQLTQAQHKPRASSQEMNCWPRLIREN
jgi:enamine deaminase RidA (YjgF/YER057c/UK114 family)